MLPVHIKTYYFNISYWNERPDEPATFTELYDFAEEFGLEDLRPSNIAKLSSEFLSNEQKAQRYRQLKRSARHEAQPCDSTCRQAVYCETFTSVYKESMECKPHFEEIDYQHKLFSTMTDPWIEKIKHSTE